VPQSVYVSSQACFFSSILDACPYCPVLRRRRVYRSAVRHSTRFDFQIARGDFVVCLAMRNLSTR
jgi:hypothetical protein